MPNQVKSPLTCDTANFGPEEKDPNVMKLLSCSAWRSLDDVNVERLGLRGRRSLEERMFEGVSPEEAVLRIGSRCSDICIRCERFIPKHPQPQDMDGDTADVEQFLNQVGC